jgi:hypothetical protein
VPELVKRNKKSKQNVAKPLKNEDLAYHLQVGLRVQIGAGE